MITKFDSGFAGHVDMDDLGYAGTPVNDRRFPNEHLITVFDKTRATAQLMDGLGYHSLSLAEHHFQPEGHECIPNILMLAVHLANVTENIKIHCGFNITPMWHPLRLAEDFATADILTGGRVIFGVGRGYHTREVETLGSPLRDQEANRELFEEQVEIIFKAFNEESFSHHGKYYDLPPQVAYRGYELEELTLVPRPVHLPVECWQPIQGGSERAIDFMIKHGIKGVIGGGVASTGAPEIESMRRNVQGWADGMARAGRETELGEDLILGFHFYVAESPEQGIKEAALYFEENVKMFGPLRLLPTITPEQIEALNDPKRAPYTDLPSLEAAVEAGAFLCGPPDLIGERLLALEERYPGVERVMLSLPVGTPQQVMLEQTQRLAEEVMPAFINRVAEPVSAD